VSTINDAVYNYLINDSAMKSTFTKVFYLINKNIEDKNFATIYLTDDPKDIKDLCVGDQGQARFQCDAFTVGVEGTNKRQVFQDTMLALFPSTLSGYNIWKVDVVNVNDRPNTINELFQFSFEAIVHYVK